VSILPIVLSRPTLSTENLRWHALNSPVAQLHLKLGYYDRDGRVFETSYLRWAVQCVNDGCCLLSNFDYLDTSNASASLSAHNILRSLDPFLQASEKYTDGLLSVGHYHFLQEIYTALLAWLAKPGRCRWHSGPRAARDFETLIQRVGEQLWLELVELTYRLVGAFKAPRSTLQIQQDLQVVCRILVRSGVLLPPRLRVGELATAVSAETVEQYMAEQMGPVILRGIQVGYRQADPISVQRYKEVMEALLSAYLTIAAQVHVPANLADPEFRILRDRWIASGHLEAAPLPPHPA
jgi:hypothetical protein